MIQAIEDKLRAVLSGVREPSLKAAMAYSALGGGKRLRPQLLLSACEAAAGFYDDNALQFACAAEMIHTYSLIHDDLPAMDDDDLRRGRPTCHKVYGEALAILAGDALLTHAFEQMAAVCAAADANRFAKAMALLARAAGANGMVAGQVADMEGENKKITEDTLLRIQERKTGALIKACLEAGAVIGGGDGTYTAHMARIGALLGCAFQIKDDILDITATTDVLGKPAHSDEKNQKNTYVTVFGLARAQADYARLSAEARDLLAGLPQKTDTLRRLVERIIARLN